MEEIASLKLITGLITAAGGIALYKLNLAQTQKFRAELLEKLELALESEKIHATCELFFMLHGLRMEYEDIKAICSDSKGSKAILALKKSPGMVKYENGKFQYTSIYAKPWVRSLNRNLSKWLASLMAILTLIIICIAPFSDGVTSIALLLLIVPSFAFMAMQLRDIRHDVMIEGLVCEKST